MARKTKKQLEDAKKKAARTSSTLESKVRDADLEAHIRGIADAAVSEQARIRGGARTRPHHTLKVDGLPEAGGGADIPPPLGAARAETAQKSIAVIGRNFEHAFELLTDWLAETTGAERRPSEQQVKDCAESWQLVLEGHGERWLGTHPELVAAAVVTGLAFMPMTAEIYWREKKKLAKKTKSQPTETRAADGSRVAPIGDMVE